MDLWIRSQERERLTKPMDLQIVPVNNGTEYAIISFTETAGDITLGLYESKERALEVLDDIEYHLINSSFAKKINGLGEVKDIIPIHIFIYEMPKE